MCDVNIYVLYAAAISGDYAIAVHCVKILVSIGKTPETVKVEKDGKQAA